MTSAAESRKIIRQKAAAEILRRRAARRSLLAYLAYCWWMPHELKIGIHTRAIAARVDKAIEDFERGVSSFLVFVVPHRHGKSDLISRALPGYFLGRCSDVQPDVMSTGYGAGLVHKFSRRARAIVDSEPYRALFPHVRLSDEKRTDAEWKVDHYNNGAWKPSAGEVNASGLSGRLTGSGYHLGLLDDFCKSREEAESLTYRDKVWEQFANDFMTRRAPVSITIITATMWHVDDLVGRIRKARDDDPYFPQFEYSVFPARGPANLNGETIAYKQEYLFQERFPVEWYLGEYATLRPYAASALLDCSPTIRAGNLFCMDFLKYHEEHEFPSIPYFRAWDLASTEKEVAKSDPDYTAGPLLGVTYEKDVPQIWIKDLIVGQWSAPKRDRTIVGAAERDGSGTPVLVEQVAGYKDTVENLKAILAGRRSVKGITVSGDKVVRASPMEPVFEAGNVHLLRAPWNDLFFSQFQEFPYGAHDDIPDAVAIAYTYASQRLDLSTIGRVPRESVESLSRAGGSVY